jgi:hypothetical protein
VRVSAKTPGIALALVPAVEAEDTRDVTLEVGVETELAAVWAFAAAAGVELVIGDDTITSTPDETENEGD